MNRHTRKMLLNIATGFAVAATAAVVFLPAAYAAPGTVTSNVNVRSGPGTNYSVVDTIRRGEQVDVQQCQNSWCYVVKSGPDGWVSATYLSAGGGQPVNPTQPGLSFGFTVGPNGPSVNIGVGNQPQPPVAQPQPPRPPIYQPQPPRPPIYQPQPPRPPFGQPQQPQRPPFGQQPQPPRPPVVQPQPQPAAEVCFFERTQMRGASFCLRSGDSTANLGNWTDRISSIDNARGLQVQVCSEPNYRDCRTYTTSASSLGDFDDFIGSVRVR